MRASRRAVLALGAVAVAALAVVAVAAVLAGGDGGDEAGARPVATAPVVELQAGEPGEPPGAAEPAEVEGFLAGEATVPQLEAYPTPDPPPGTAPVATATNPTREGFPLVVSVVEASPDGGWLHVRLPQRPNGIGGWVPAEHVRTWTVPNRIEVSLSTHTLTVYRGRTDEVLFHTDVATGRPQTPTPVGEFFIDIVNRSATTRSTGGASSACRGSARCWSGSPAGSVRSPSTAGTTTR